MIPARMDKMMKPTDVFYYLGHRHFLGNYRVGDIVLIPGHSHRSIVVNVLTTEKSYEQILLLTEYIESPATWRPEYRKKHMLAASQVMPDEGGRDGCIVCEKSEQKSKPPFTVAPSTKQHHSVSPPEHIESPITSTSRRSHQYNKLKV